MAKPDGPPCGVCNKPMERQSGRGGVRRYHPTCRPPRKPRAAVVQVPGVSDLPRKAGELESAVRAELARAERDKTWRGAAAIRLARECDTAKGSQVSSLIKQLELAMDAALDGVVLEPDWADEVTARRHERMQA